MVYSVYGKKSILCAKIILNTKEQRSEAQTFNDRSRGMYNNTRI